MKKLTITINTENAAFNDDLEAEIIRILKKICENITLFDITENHEVFGSNGNYVGDVTIE